MSNNNAVLLQDYRAFIGELEPQFSQLLQEFPGMKKQFIHWLISHELENVYGLFDDNFLRWDPISDQIYQRLNQLLSFSISSCFMHYIKAPRVYPDDNGVSVTIIEPLTLCIHYDSKRLKYIP